MSTLRCDAETKRSGLSDRGHLADGTAGVTGPNAPNALNQIEACIPALRRYAVALMRSRDAADDLVHDCLVRALDELHTRRDETDLRLWLFTIMHNMFTGRKRRRRFGLPAGVFHKTTHQSMHDQPISEEEALHWCDLLRGLERLPDQQRGAVLLVSVEDLPYPEAATVLGVPARMMMSHLARGRERLRQFTSTDVGPALRRVKWAVTPAA